jgi:threonine/homoserine/homoserine lactone efflux protein
VFYLALLPTIVDVSHVGVLGRLQLTMTTRFVLAPVACAWALLAVRANITDPPASRESRESGQCDDDGEAAVAIAAR